MKTNRGKSSSKRNKKEGTNIAMFVAPLLILLLTGWGVYALFIKSTEGPGKNPISLIGPIEPAMSGIKATIYFDNSASMKGYADANQNAYLDVLSDLRGFYPNTNAVIGGKNIPGEELIDRIRLHQINYSKESLLYHDIDMIASQAQKDIKNSKNKLLPINFYLTDGIMSGSDAQIRKDSEYNKIHAQDLQNQIREVLAGKDSIGVSVYQFKSQFVGEYWAYDNTHGSLNSMRYFYVMAIGSRPALSNFKHKVDSINASRIETYSKFNPIAQWHAIDNQIINTNLLVGPSGAVNFNGSEYTYKPKVINNQGGFVSFNLDAIVFRNYYIENMDTLACRSKVEIDGRQIKDINVIWDKKAHAFTFKIPIGKLAKENTVCLTIPRLRHKWIDNSSMPDDKYMLRMPDLRTFLFDKFMQGIQSGMSGASAPTIYRREIKLKQE